jgi:hypothetical protein
VQLGLLGSVFLWEHEVTPVLHSDIVFEHLKQFCRLFLECFMTKYEAEGLWCLCSLDMNPGDFYFWGMLKEEVYSNSPCNEDFLKK